jgi:hypothetical protein
MAIDQGKKFMVVSTEQNLTILDSNSLEYE